MIETDKCRDVRRGASRFPRRIKQSGGHNQLFSEKRKKLNRDKCTVQSRELRLVYLSFSQYSSSSYYYSLQISFVVLSPCRHCFLWFVVVYYCSCAFIQFIEGLTLNGVADFVSSEKSKKERTQRPGAVNKACPSYEEEEKKYEMGCDVSDREEELPSREPSCSSAGGDGGPAKKIKLPRNFFDDCGGVNHASVPRKLRSAMKKRNCESISPPFPHPRGLSQAIGGVESPKRVSVKKSKPNVSVCGPMTKDEEEVVETLYALAGMFQNYGSKLDNASFDTFRAASPEANESPPTALQDCAAINGDLISSCLPITDATTNPAFNLERLPEEMVKVDSLNASSTRELPYLPSSKARCKELGSSSGHVNLHILSPKHEEGRQICNSADFNIPPPAHEDTGNLPPDSKPEIALELTAACGNQLHQQLKANESRAKGTALWPGLSSKVSRGTWSHGALSESPATNIPSWLDSALYATGPDSLESGHSTGKISETNNDRRSWKRSVTHVHISRFIRILQTLESTDSSVLHVNQLKPHEILKQGVLMTMNNFGGMGNGSNRVTSARSTVDPTGKNPSEVSNSVFQHQRFHQEQPNAALAFGGYNSQKQSFNLSLSAGGSGVGANNGFNRGGNGVEPVSRPQLPYLHSQPQLQLHTHLPFSMSQAHPPSSAYIERHSSAAAQQAQRQLHNYLGSSINGPHTSTFASTKQQYLQHQQLWAAQLSAQYKNIGTSTPVAHFPSWQNGRQDLPALMPRAPSIILPSSPSLEVLSSKYHQISEQQHQLSISSPTPHARVKRQDHHLSSIYEETVPGFRASAAQPLQLLCNERL